MLDKIERQFAALAERRGLRLRVRPSRARVHTDPKLLQRVLFNLVNNALRYTRTGGVLVGCRARDDRLRIEVWDTGPGIAESERERIFEEFERLDTRRGDPEFAEGLGLGLSICRRISRMLEAPLTLHSRPGRGSVFAVTVPRLAGRASATQTPVAARGSAGGFEGLDVLCIDDDREILDGMRMLLQRWGCDVRVASTRAEALDHRRRVPDLIIADHHLGAGDDGLSVSRALLDDLQRCVPVLILTADRDEALAERIKALGHAQLYKPVKPAALRALMRHLVETSAAKSDADR
jgi:CheY-like chemotaxis protein/anti-sigma regulatory factor (Ser/Thr protein kinase)